MILQRIGDLVYFNNSGISHYTHISRLDFIDLGSNKAKVLIRPFNSDLVYWEGQVSAILDINGNSYGNKISDIIVGLGSSSISINTNGAIGDAFGRLRISNPYSIFDSKELDGSADRVWTETTINFWEAAAAGTDTVLEADVSPFTIEEGFVAGSKNAPAANIAPADNLLTVGQCATGCRSAFLIYAQAYGANTMRYALKFKEVL
jgi:hypothetical protein